MRPQIHVIDREMSTSAEKQEPAKATGLQQFALCFSVPTPPYLHNIGLKAFETYPGNRAQCLKYMCVAT